MAEFRLPLGPRQRHSVRELVEQHRGLTPTDYEEMRAEDEAFFGDDERIVAIADGGLR